MASDHDLKVWQMFYDALAVGRKPFEVRKNDRDFKVGDTLRLREWDNYGEGGYTGRECIRTVTYILSGDEVVDFGVQRGFVVMGVAASTTENAGQAGDAELRALIACAIDEPEYTLDELRKMVAANPACGEHAWGMAIEVDAVMRIVESRLARAARMEAALRRYAATLTLGSDADLREHDVLIALCGILTEAGE